MTYNVFGGTLNLAQPIAQPIMYPVAWLPGGLDLNIVY